MRLVACNVIAIAVGGLRTVKSHIGTFSCSQLIAEAEDLIVWR